MNNPITHTGLEKSRLPHLDALRAAAVTIVVLFHLKIPGFSAGYLGVDLFFMLSGFLMTWTMLRDKAQFGRFRVRAFYARRIQRIVPSLVLTILMTLVVAYLMISPAHLIDTARQAQAALFFTLTFSFITKLVTLPQKVR